MAKWVFEDPVTTDTYTWEVNPNEGGSPSFSKNLQYMNTTAPGGTVLIFEGQDEAKTSSFSGVVLSEAQYYEMITWFNKRYPINYTDDLDRTYTIYIRTFTPRRERARSHPWKHSYTCDYVILSGTDV